MKTHKILFEHLGEYSYTEKQPVAVYHGGMVDLSAQTTHTILSSDDWRPCPVQRYEVRDVELPDWLSPENWLHNCNYVMWGFTWLIREEVKHWPQAWQTWLVGLCERDRRAAVKLLATENFRSEFRHSLRAQLETWLDADPNERQHPSPFSPRQWAVLTKWER